MTTAPRGMRTAIGITLVLGATLVTAIASGCSSDNGEAARTAIPLKEAKLNIEHNATDHDTGFQGFIDSEGWNNLEVTGPDGKVLELRGKGELGNLGLTELFFESVEPANTDIPIEDVLATLPEGEYTISGNAIEAGERMGKTSGVALLTHDIPAGPELLTPANGAAVPAAELLFSWRPVTETLSGGQVTIIAYQLIVEADEEPYPHMVGKMGFSMYVPADVTSMSIGAGFLEPGTSYKWEVLAIEESGNQTLSSGEFSTE